MNGVLAKQRKFLRWACLCSLVFLISGNPGAERPEHDGVYSLPSEVAEKLRALNPVGERGSCHESSIFIHGYKFLDLSFDKVIWFLGAPDYLCDTNSFIPAFIDARGNWTIGTNAKEAWNGSDLLDGVPRHFKHHADVGMFLTAEWQIEGPVNLLFYSRTGETWTSLPLPPDTPKSAKSDCCDAPVVASLCLADTGHVYVEFEESEVFAASTWAASAGEALADDFSWRLESRIPAEADCAESLSTGFMPRTLRQKTRDGAIFDVFVDFAVRIPGPTK